MKSASCFSGACNFEGQGGLPPFTHLILTPMKKILTLFLLAITVGPAAQAQWTTDVSLNTTVRAVSTGEAAVQLITEGPDGSTYASWFENGSGSYQLRMQRLDMDGNRIDKVLITLNDDQ